VGRMRWKEDEFDSILNAVPNKVGRDVTVMSVAKEKAIFMRRLKTKLSACIEMLNPLKAVIVIRPAVVVCSKLPTRWQFFRQPTRHKILPLENNIWFHFCSRR